MKTSTVTAVAGAGLLLLFTVTSCGRSGADEPRAASAASIDTTTAAADTAPELSDLDRPVEELLAMTCEHQKRTFECDECRYETGVVRAPADLVSGGLIATRKVARERLAASLDLTGEVQFDERQVVHLNTQAEGSVRSVFVALGDRVKKGEPLLEIESMAVGEAEGAYLEAQAMLQLARRNFERVAQLRAESIASEKEHLQSRQEFETAQIRVASAQGVLGRLGMSAADVAHLDQGSPRGRLVLRAPSAGTVLQLHAVPGEFTKTDESLAILGDNSTVWVWADLYEKDLARVAALPRRGPLPADVSVKAYPGETFPGVVDLVRPTMEEASRTVRLRVEVKNPTGRLLAGMFADVALRLPGREDALTVPRSAVLEDEGRSFVFVHLDGEYYVRRPVVLGLAMNGSVEVTRGLSGGETVVTDGSFLMKSDVLRSKMGAGCAD